MRRSAAIIVLLLGGVISFEARANTLIIVLRSEDAAIIAADSQVSSTGQGLPAGSTCKIRITNDYVWATAGILQETRGPFNVWVKAETAIRMGGTLEEIASRFETVTANELKDFLPRFKATEPENFARILKQPLIITGIFFERNNLVNSDFLVPNIDTPQHVEIIRHTCPGNCPVTGGVQLVIGDHDVVDTELASSPDIWQSKGIIGAMNYLVEMQHRATPNSVAAPVSIMRIDKSGALQWLQKGKCDQ